MSLARVDASMRPRGALAGVGILLAFVLPLVLFTAVDATTPTSVALVALVLATLVGFADRGAQFAGRLLVARFHTADLAPPVLAGRVTDPVHHPLRPRAPGTA